MKANIELSSERLRKFRDSLRREYDASSKVKEFLTIKFAREDEDGRFVRIGQRFSSDGKPFVDAYSRGGHYYSPEIFGIGHSIAIGEDKYIIAQLQKRLKLREMQTRSEMLDYLMQFGELEFTAAFIPLEYYMNLHDLRNTNFNISYDGPKPHVRVGGQSVRVFWSNKYTPFESFFFVTKSSMEWLLKRDPESGHAVRVSVGLHPESEKLTVSVQTIAFLNFLNAEQAFAFTLKEQPLK
jgi:hypothetical protein